MKKIIFTLGATLALMACTGGRNIFAATNPIVFRAAGTDFIVPFQKVKGTQLYSLQDKKGYPGVETVLAGWGAKDAQGDWQGELTFGAAPVLGTSNNVPFFGLQARLPAKFFDTSNNSLMFGAYLGRESGQKRATWGIKASISLW